AMCSLPTLRSSDLYVYSSLCDDLSSFTALIVAIRKAIVIYAVTTTWNTLTHDEGLNIAAIGSIFKSSPPSKSNPAGVFINEFTVVIKTADKVEPITIGIFNSQWYQGFLKRSHVYKNIPRNIASKKNAKVSINSGNAII